MHESKECRDRTKLIIFLGTPHRGSEFADWARIATNVMNTILDSNQELVDNLEVNSVVLDNINEKFLRIVCEDKINIYSFYEARGISGFKLFSGKVRCLHRVAMIRHMLTAEGCQRYLLQTQSSEAI